MKYRRYTLASEAGLIAAICTLGVIGARGQTSASQGALTGFEVASVKPSAPDDIDVTPHAYGATRMADNSATSPSNTS